METYSADKDFRLKKFAIYLSLAIGILIFVIKILAYFLTGSTAIFSDAAESVVHILATAMAVYSVLLSAKPPDEDHLYGHGNVEFFSAGIEGTLIIIAAIAIIYNAIKAMVFGTQPKVLDYGTFLIAAAGIINLVLGFYLIRKGKQTNSITLVADGHHVLTDSYTSLGIVFGLVIVMFTKLYILDPIIALIVASNIIITGYKLVRESISGLMHETDNEILEQIINKMNEIRREYWIDLHHLRFWKSANVIYIDFHLSIPHYFTIKEAHKEEDFIEEKLAEVLSRVDVRIHFDYCDEILCHYCEYKECKQRVYPHEQTLKWDKAKVLGGPVNK